MANDLAIAIIGMSCRFPGADTPEEFWRNLVNGTESITELSESELIAEGVPPELYRNPAYVRRRPVLRNVENFDAGFFGLSPTEAAITDPQHRLFLECAWEALERAGCNPFGHDGRIGVFAGCGLDSYLLRNIMGAGGLERSVTEFQIALGNDKDFIATRAAYKLDLKGPAINVNTACSTSLVAVHMAVQSLLAWQCDMALAGAASVQLPHHGGYLYQEGGISSADGHCRPFDAQGGGTVGGSGAGVVALKRLADAVADGDPILAVIRGSAVNNDGADKIGFTAPSVGGQSLVIADALAFAELDPDSIGYVEAHGTATPLGDPIEVTALNTVFGNRRAKLPMGSVKGNIGHLDTAAGMAGLIKTVLALGHGRLPPTLHFNAPNPHCAFGPLEVVSTLRDWPAAGPRLAGVSSFGIGGTNAHVVLEQAPPPPPSAGARPWQVLPVSARSATSLSALSLRLADHLSTDTVDLADAAFTLQQGRRAFSHRRAVAAADPTEAAAALRGEKPGTVVDGIAPEQPPRTVFLFPGQGSQHSGMAALLHREEPVFRAAFDQCAKRLSATGLDLTAILTSGDDATLRRTDMAQPVLFAVEYALAVLWKSWGIEPQAMIGHSLGEWVAACLAGVVGLDDALDIVAERGRLMAAMAPGAMLAVPLSEAEAIKRVNAQIALAAVNAPRQCVLSGSMDSIDRLEAALAAEGIDARRLATSHAFHSPMMEAAAQSFRQVVASKRLDPPRIPFISNLTGTWITGENAVSPDYWARQMREAVRFDQGLRTVLAEPGILVEMGPGRTLSGLADRHPARTAEHGIVSVLAGAKDEAKAVSMALAGLWVAGLNLNWPAIQGGSRRKVVLPTTIFERSRHWISPSPAKPATAAKPAKGLHTAPVWVPAPLAATAEAPTHWLIFADRLGVAAAAANLLRARNAVVTLVEQDAAAADRDGMMALFDDLREHPPQAILHLWSLTGETPPGLDHARRQGLDSLILLSKGLGRRHIPHPLRIVVASDYMQAVGDEIALHPEKAPLLGPVLVLPQEFLNVSAVSVDVTGAAAAPETIARILLAEAAAAAGEPFIAWRGGRRLAQRMESVALPRAPESHPVLRQGGAYVITGGLGGVGLEIAEAIAQTVQAKLVLVSRSGLPPRAEWPRLKAQAGPEHGGGFDLTAETAAIDHRLDSLEAELAIRTLDSYAGLESRIKQVCSALLLDWLEDESIDLAARHRVADLTTRLRILPKFVKFFDFVLAELAEDGHVRRQGDMVEFGPRPLHRGKDLNAALCADFPGFAAMLRLLEHCVDHYGAALAGDVEAISVLFPDGGEGLMLASAKKSVEFINARTYRMLAREVIADCVRKARPRRIRILEVGGGNGVATGIIAPALRGENVEYHFTDLGKSFVLAAEQNAKALGLDFMTFGTLDIGRDPAEQGYAPESFDIIIGLDVVHATPSIGRTMTLLKGLLKPGGAAYLLETVRSQRWDNMIGGLAEGWWYVEDDYRNGMPLMSADSWDRAIRTLGFRQVEVWPRDAARRDTTDCALVIAQTDGVPASVEQDDPVAARIRRMEAIEATGSEIMVAAAHVADEAAMATVLSDAENRFGPIRGVIHSAMDMRSGSMQLKTTADMDAELAPKVAGTLVLDRLLRSRDPDFLALCSSMTAATGGFGNAVYCAANAFIDAFAPVSNRTRPTLAIAWGRWQGIGFAQAFESWHQRMTGEVLQGGLSPTQGREAFLRAIAAQGLVRLGVAAEDRSGADTPAPAEIAQAAAVSVPSSPGARAARPPLSTPFAAPVTPMERSIATVWQEVLGLDCVGVDDDFSDLGGDSLIAIQVASRLREDLGMAIPVRLLFDHPTVRGLAEASEARQVTQNPPDDDSEDQDEGVL